MLVTGGTSGIGKAICELAKGAGAHVLTCGTDPKRLEESELRGVPAVEVDLADPGSTKILTEAVDRFLGRLDVLVNCAGVQVEWNVAEFADRHVVRT
ncbi:MAG: SDR family oxidoreductase [Planctomycetota bacterium]